LLHAVSEPDTKITTDLVVFCKTGKPQGNWQGITQVELDCGYRDCISDYYIEHPEHLLGKVEKYEAWLSKEQRKRQGLTVSGAMNDVTAKLPKLIDGIEPIYTGHQKADKGCVIDFKQKEVCKVGKTDTASTGDYDEAVARLNAVAQELGEIAKLLREVAA